MSGVTLVLGGARSGKSRFAESLLNKHRGRKFYIATAEALDDEMRVRIERHRERRSDELQTIEAPVELLAALDQCQARPVLIDCLTLWISNLMHHGRKVKSEVEAFGEMLQKRIAPTVIVSNEVGLGIVPENALARAFRDEQGFANQHIAELADEVVFMVSGLPVVLKKARRRSTRLRSAGSRRGGKGRGRT